MPLSELTELVILLDHANLEASAESGALVRRIEQIGTLLERVGAANAAAQLGLAASLLGRSRRTAEEGEGIRGTVRTLVTAVERAFHVDTPMSEGAHAPSGAQSGALAARRESRRPSAAIQLRLRVAHDMMLGEMLVHFGVVTQTQLETALQLQRGTRRRLGEVLVEQGITTQAEIQLALDYQQRIRENSGAERKAEPGASVRASSPSAPLPSGEKHPAQLRMATELLLGEILVLQDVITRKELEQALQQQRRDGLLLGETLLRSGRVTRHQLQSALTMQGSRRCSRTRPKE